MFVISGLGTGGAEAMLLKLLERIDRRRFSPHVISLTSLGQFGHHIAALGIPVEALGMTKGASGLIALMRLSQRLRLIRPNVVHTWMYHADLLGGLAARFACIKVVVWGIRNSDLHPEMIKVSTRTVVALNARLSNFLPSRILSCSEAARLRHVARGYADAKMVVIPNGFDLERFTPDEVARASVRVELGLAPDTPLVGIVGRYDPQKNHVGFIEAAGLLRQNRPDVHFVLVGTNVDSTNKDLITAAKSSKVFDAVHLLGLRSDMPRLMAAFDVLASSSYGEAFPNVLGEAMACGVPCAVTNVGDSADIVGGTGSVVEAGDVSGLAAAMKSLLDMPSTERRSLGLQARKRVQEYFEIGDVVRRYESFYERVVNES